MKTFTRFDMRSLIQAEIGNDAVKRNATAGKAAPAPAVKKSQQTGYCGSCYGAEDAATKCCQTCSEVKMAYRHRGWAFVSSKSIEQCVDEGVDEETVIHSGEGCHAYGYVEVNKVAGNFHFAPGKSFSQGMSPYF
jgi:hypothetical protein